MDWNKVREERKKKQSPEVTTSTTRNIDWNSVRAKRHAQDVALLKQNYPSTIKQLENDASEVSRYQFNKNNWWNESKNREYSSKSKDNTKKIENILRVLKNDNQLDELTNTSLNKMKTQFETVSGALDEERDYFSQWENEDSFNYAKAQDEKKKRYSAMTDEELDAEIEKNKEGNKWYNKVIDKVAEIGSYIPTTDANTPISTITKQQQAQKTVRGAVEQSKTESLEKDSNIALLQKEKNNRVLKEFEKLPDDVKNLLKGYVEADRKTDETNIGNIGASLANALTGQQGGSNAYNTQNATAKSEAEEYARLLNEKGVDWTKYVEPLRIASDEGYYANSRKENKEFAKEHPFMASAVSVLESPVKALGTLEMLESAVDGSSNQLNYNSPYFIGNRLVNDTREQVMINNNWVVDANSDNPLKRKDWFDMFYGMAMSSGDSLVGMAMSGPVNASKVIKAVTSSITNEAMGETSGGAGILGLQAATDTAIETAENGGSKWDALVTGTIAGVNEALFEKISIGNLKSMATKDALNYFSKNGVKTIVANLAKSAGINATEEMCTEAANIVTDYLINGGTSSFVENYNAGLAQGLSEAEAKKQAYTAMVSQIGEAGVSGALQGLLFGGVGSATAVGSQRAEERSVGKQYNNTEYMELREKAQELGVDVDKYRYGNNVKVGRLETVVTDRGLERAKAELVKNAESYGIDVSKYLSGKKQTLSDENFVALQDAYNERFKEIEKEVSEQTDLIWRNAFKEQLVMMGETSDKASILAGKAVRVINGDTSNGVILSGNAEKLLREYESGNPRWVELANEKIVKARVETENKYITRLEDKIKLEDELKAVKEASAKVEGSKITTEDIIKEESATLDDKRKDVFNKTWDSVVSASAGDNYVTWFNEVFNAGLKGRGTFEAYDKLVSYMHYDTTESWRRDVYNAGLQTRFYTPGLHRHDNYGEGLSKVQKAQLDVLDAVGKRYDIAIITVNDQENVNGWYKKGSNRIIVSIDAEGDLLLKTAGHELYHYIEEWSPEGAKELKEVVLDNLSKTEKWNYEAELSRYAKLYGLDKVADREAIESEIAADCMFDVLSNEKFVDSLVKTNETLAQKILSFFKDFLKEIKNMLNNFHNSSQLEALREYRVLVEQINDYFSYYLGVASENAEKVKNAELQSTAENSEQKNNTTENSGVKYSLKQYSEHQIENWKSSDKIIVYENSKQLKEFIKDSQKGIGLSRKMYFGYISSELANEIRDVTGVDVSNYNCTLRASEIRKILKKHGDETSENKRGQRAVTSADFELIPEVIQNPDNIALSEKLFEGKPVIEFSKVIDGKIVVSAYVSKKHLDLTVQSMYAGIKKGNLATVAGEQAPADTPEANVGTVSTNIISDKVEKINQKSEKSVKSLKLSADAKKVLEENPELKSAFLYLQSQFKLVKDYVPSEEQLMSYAKQLKKQTSTTIDVYELKNDLRDIYTVLQSMTDSRGLEYASGATIKLANKILENSKILDDENLSKQEMRKQLNSTLKGQQFRLTEGIKQEINSRYGSWQEFVKKSHGVSMHFSKDAKYTLESEWEALCSELPDLLDASINEKDQVFALIEAYEATGVDYGLHDEYQFNSQLQYIATEILESIEQIPSEDTFRAVIEDRHAREMNELKEETDKTIKALKKKHQDNLINKSDYWRKEIKKKAEQKRMTENRNKIEKQLVRLAGMLAKGTKNRHVPIQLIESVKELCEMFVLRNSKQTKLSELLGKVEANYDALVESDDYTFRNAFSNEVAELITQLNKDVGNKNVNSMTADELEQVNEVVRAIAQKVSRSNQLFIEGRKETATETALKVIDELTHQKTEYAFKREKLNDFLNAATETGERFGWKLLKPVYAFRLIGSDTLIELEKNLRKGEDVWAVDLSEAKERFTKLAEEYHHNNWKEEKVSVNLFQGEVTFSIQQLMFLYCAFQRKQFVPHLLNGGFAFEKEYVAEKVPELDAQGKEKRDKNGKVKKYKRYVRGGTVRLHQDDFEAIKKALTAEQRAYADSMRDYLSFDLAEKGNAVTRRLYDTNRFVEDKYFPIKAATEYLRTDTKDVSEKSILGMGINKELQEMADNPVLLRDFDTVWAEHVQQMATYHAFALRIDDFNKVYNYGTKNTVAEVNSVKAKLKAAWGKEAVNYVETFLKDVNGRLRVDDGGNFLTKGISNFKKASVLASASVIIQQPSAIIRAMAEVNIKYFGIKPSYKEYKEMMQYAPVTRIKEMGFFDTGIGPSTVNWLLEPTYEKDEIIKGLLNDGDYRKKAYDKVVTFGPEIMDKLTWIQIWKAVKKEQQANNPSLEGEELLKKTAERFTEVIELTQVYDSVFSKSEIMRSKDTGAKMATAFMAEPTVSLNMYVDAVVQGKRTSKRKMARIITCVVFSSLLNAILKSMVAASRDDDEKKTQLEKYISAVLSNWVNDVLPWNMVPIARDVASIFNGYDVERSDMSVITSLYNVLLSCLDDEKSTGTKFIDVAGAVAALFGVPLKNVVRDIRAGMNLWNRIWNTEKDIFDLEWAAISLGFARNFNSNIIVKLIKGGEKKNSDYMYEAVKKQYMERYSYLVKELGSPEAVHKAMMQGLKDNDSRVLEAAQYRLKGDSVSYGATIKEMVSDNFPEKQVVAAVNSVYKDITEETEEESPEKEKSIYNSVDLYNAVNSGTNYAEIIDDMIEVEMANGKTEEQAENTVRDRVNDYWKEEFLNASESEQEVIRDKLDKTGLYEDVEETTNNWLKAVLLERYDEATSYSQRKMIENQLYALGVYKDRNSLKAALKRRTEDDSEEK